METKKDSLVLKILFYNNLGIILSTVFLASILIFFDYASRTNELKSHSVNRIVLLEKAYNNKIEELRGDVLRITRELNIVTNTDENEIEVYKKYIEDMRAKLMQKDIETYYYSVISIVDPEGNTLAESGLKKETKKTVINKSLFLSTVKSSRGTEVGDYPDSIEGENYIRIYFPQYLKSGKVYFLLTIPMNYKMIQEFKDEVQLSSKDRIFIFSKNQYYLGDFPYDNKEILQIKDSVSKLGKYYEKYRFSNEIIDKKNYYIGLYLLKTIDREYRGSIGIAFSKETLEIAKKRNILMTIGILILYLIIGSNITNKFFTKLLKPLNELSDGTQEIINGNYDYSFKESGVGEIRLIGSSLKKMLEEVKNNREEILKQNEKLNENILRIEAIERILMGIHIEIEMLPTLLKALTSDMGLGYSRAMYFRYSREGDCLLGEKTVVNGNLEVDNEKSLKTGFKFQIEELKNLISSIKIPYDRKNLIGESLKDKKVMRFNDKGYKHELGNPLFKGLGINNFMILPIYAKNRNYGVILVDYFSKDKTISTDEFELMKLLIMNLTIRISNKLIEEERVDKERENTIRKLTERFLGRREKYIESVYALIDGHRSGKKNLETEIKDIENILKILRYENKVLKEYSQLGLTKPEFIDLESLFNEIKVEHYEAVSKEGISISIFINYSGRVFGKREDLKKAFYEIMKNSYMSLLKSENKDKKINVIVSKDKNIDKVRINIIDNGVGIKKEQLEKIYEPFLTIDGKPGLGLSLVYRVIKEHQGVIKFFSKYKEGTDVKITLNAYKEEKY